VKLDFGDYCGAGECYHYYLVKGITSVTPPSLEKLVMDACSDHYTHGTCVGHGVEKEKMRATVSLMEGLTSDKKWLSKKTWSVKSWTIQDEHAPFAQCRQ